MQRITTSDKGHRSPYTYATQRFCDRVCQTAWQRINYHGANNHNYRGGVSTEANLIRSSEAYRQWRIAVFKRDNYTCQICGQVGGTLHADHIMPFAIFPRVRLDLLNGRTLCKECHSQTSTYQGAVTALSRRILQLQSMT